MRRRTGVRRFQARANELRHTRRMADIKPTAPRPIAPTATSRATPDAEVAKLRDLLRSGPGSALPKADAFVQSLGVSTSRAQLLGFIKG
jgi:hypothetical protein